MTPCLLASCLLSFKNLCPRHANRVLSLSFLTPANLTEIAPTHSLHQAKALRAAGASQYLGFPSLSVPPYQFHTFLPPKQWKQSLGLIRLIRISVMMVNAHPRASDSEGQDGPGLCTCKSPVHKASPKLWL